MLGDDRSSSKKQQFDMEMFKRMMGDGLGFADEGEATPSSLAIAEEQQWTWYETYLLAKETHDRLSLQRE